MPIEGASLGEREILPLVFIASALAYPLLNHVKHTRHAIMGEKVRFEWIQLKNAAILGITLGVSAWGMSRFGGMSSTVLETPAGIGTWLVAGIGMIWMADKIKPGYLANIEHYDWSRFCVGPGITVIVLTVIQHGGIPDSIDGVSSGIWVLYALMVGMIVIADRCLARRPSALPSAEANVSADPPNTGGDTKRQIVHWYLYRLANVAVQRAVAEIVRFVLANLHDAVDLVLTSINNAMDAVLARLIEAALCVYADASWQRRHLEPVWQQPSVDKGKRQGLQTNDAALMSGELIDLAAQDCVKPNTMGMMGADTVDACRGIRDSIKDRHGEGGHKDRTRKPKTAKGDIALVRMAI